MSEIRQQATTPAAIRNLLLAFQGHGPHVLLFLKSVRKISLLARSAQGGPPQLLHTISQSSQVSSLPAREGIRDSHAAAQLRSPLGVHCLRGEACPSVCGAALFTIKCKVRPDHGQPEPTAWSCGMQRSAKRRLLRSGCM